MFAVTVCLTAFIAPYVAIMRIVADPGGAAQFTVTYQIQTYQTGQEAGIIQGIREYWSVLLGIPLNAITVTVYAVDRRRTVTVANSFITVTITTSSQRADACRTIMLQPQSTVGLNARLAETYPQVTIVFTSATDSLPYVAPTPAPPVVTTTVTTTTTPAPTPPTPAPTPPTPAPTPPTPTPPTPAPPPLMEACTPCDANVTNIVISTDCATITATTIDPCRYTLETVTFNEPSRLTTIGPHAFQDTYQLTGFSFPSSVTTLEPQAFQRSGLTSITIPTTITTIGSHIFYQSQLQSVTIQNNVIGQSMFQNCIMIETITIPATVTTVGIDAFRDCHLSYITILNNVIGENMFSYNFGGFTVMIPASISSIGDNAFLGDTSALLVFAQPSSFVPACASYGLNENQCESG